MERFTGALFFIFVFLSNSQAFSDSEICPGFERFKDSCGIAQKFSDIKEKAAGLSKKLNLSIDPTKFRDVMARRFINGPDWEKFLKTERNDYDPRCVYEPKPLTWRDWQNTYENSVEKLVLSDKPLTSEILLQWNKGALVNTVSYTAIGEFKKYGNFGNNLEKAIALSDKDIEAILNTKFVGDQSRFLFIPVSGRHIKLKWTPKVCREDLPAEVKLEETGPECKAIYKSAIEFGKPYIDKDESQVTKDQKFWVDTLKTMSQPMDFKNKSKSYWFSYACWPTLEKPSSDKNCGTITYADPHFVNPELNKLLKKINSFLDQDSKSADPIKFAATMQRQLVALHPFNKGNGRVTRWIMDFITERSGLPPVIIDNMDLDLSTPEKEYAMGAVNGAKESLERMNKCLDQYVKASSPEEFAKIANSPCGLVKPVSDTAFKCDL